MRTSRPRGMSLIGRNTWSLVLLVFITVPQVADVTGEYHHIKLGHGRYRRHDAETYVPSSFVLDTNEQERGSWGPWSTPSFCSRSCGGGVAHQTRQCLNVDDGGYNNCSGAKKRFFSCNIQECPSGSADFWAEQCSKFNGIEFEGIYYDWIPYTGGPNKCELNCMPRGEGFLYRPKFTVTDGTPCDFEKNDVCVEGRCMPVGCDMMLGSNAREDACRECDGDGSSCNTVNGIFDTDDLQVGDNDILLIPQGATNIIVKEIPPSNNYLAIRNMTGYYYLNGNMSIDFPLSLRFAGTIFHYATDAEGFSAPDTITALGPTTEDIYIVLLYQDRNLGVHYEYSIPKKFSQQSDPGSYTWFTDAFSECSTSCGKGYKSRLVKCVRHRDNEPADETLCDPQLEPDATQDCGNEPCLPKRFEGGGHTKQIKCEQIPVDGIPSIDDDALCFGTVVGKKPVTSWTEEPDKYESTTFSSMDSPFSEDCANSTYGCCPNGKKVANGPDFEGCPCYTHQFGCCPDGVTIAKRPHGQGCECENTEFKCCSDGITPAQGPNFAGCKCDASKFGCCPDGVEEAQGENFEGCLRVPGNPGASCGIAKDAGPCRNFTVNWYFDTAYGSCSRFWYGGCDGNDNRFKTQRECKDVCVQPKGKAACYLPKIAGPCTGYYPMWYYDNERKHCVQFVYEGCLGNGNRFETRDQCEELCVALTDVVVKPGNCPVVSNSTRCERECSTDTDCSGDTKCCDNGCGTSCFELAPAEPPTTLAAGLDVTVPPIVAIKHRITIKQPEESRVSAEEGGFVTFPCIATGNPKPTIVWRKDTTVINPSEKRRRILVDGSLQIVNLYDYDRGTYICTANNGLASPARVEYQLEVKESHERSAAIVGEPNTYVTARMNSSTMLHCYAMGWPRPYVMWWREDRMVPLSSDIYEQDSDHTLLIRSVTPTTLGVYTCQAFNGIQKPVSWSVTLQAIVPVTVNVTTEKTEHSIGSDISIGCSVVGYPTPKVSWYKNNELVRTNDRIVAKISKWNLLLENWLSISNANSNDTGTYRCEAANEDSSGSASVDIRVVGLHIHPDCQDNSYFAKCDIIVSAKVCQHKFYTKFCCRSCTEAGQLPLKGPHLEAAKKRRRRSSLDRWFV